MSEADSHIFTLMLEPVKSCNLRCRHCYSDITHGGVMNGDILNQSLTKTLSYATEKGFKEIHLIWHGGEPLLAGIKFFQEAVKILAGLSSVMNIRHFIQTNGLLLNDEFCHFFREENFEVGLSLDGPRDIHDQMRVHVDGAGTFNEVMKTTTLMERHQLPFGCCSVISHISIGQEERIYRFFKELGYGLRVNPVIPAWKKSASEEFLLREGEYGEFLCRLFDEWTSTETGRIHVSPLDSYLQAVLKGKSSECQHKKSCSGSHLGVKPGGETVLCSRFEDHFLGDMRSMTIKDMFAAQPCTEIEKRAEELVECQSCATRALCNGGCPHNAAAFHQNYMVRDPFCKDYRMIYGHIGSAVKQYSNAGTNEERA